VTRLIDRLGNLRLRRRIGVLRRHCLASSIQSVVIPAGPCAVEVPVRSDLLDLLARGRFEADHFRVMSSLVRAGDACIDVGANIGLVSLELSRLVGPAGCVLAFEPEPTAFRILAANLARNGVGHVRAFNLAASDQARSATLEVPAGRSEYGSLAGVVHPSAGDGPRSCARVELDSLDNVALPLLTACRLIKLDTEGHELHVLRGASRLIARWRPYLSIEIVPSLLASHGSSPDALLALLGSWGYSVRGMDGAALDVARLGRRGYHQFVGEPG
jgi:FkbM family methyltransferase